jgi:hypothetical protein
MVSVCDVCSAEAGCELWQAGITTSLINAADRNTTGPKWRGSFLVAIMRLAANSTGLKNARLLLQIPVTGLQRATIPQNFKPP